MKCLLILLLLLTLHLNAVQSQHPTPLLERSITITFQDEKLETVLKKISQQGNFTFSYNPNVLDINRKISHSFTNKTIREILDFLFNGTLQYKTRGKYIILTKANTSSTKKTEQILSGYVVDEATGERLPDVSIYDPITLSSAVTDPYGYFEIKINKPSADVILSVKKQDYSDTVVAVMSGNKRLLNIPIKINKAKISTLADSVSQKIKRFWKTKLFASKNANLINIHDTLYRKAQFSFVPFVGTNQKLSGNVINEYSLNLLGGYAFGTRKAELGGLFNVNAADVQGAQAAGIFNAVGGKVKGVQLAGIFNVNYDSVQGAQLAGIANINWNTVSKFSAAGIVNVTRHDSQAVQLAGIGNCTFGKKIGADIAGLFNFSTDDCTSQLAGSYNFTAGNLKGAQVAGAINFAAKDVTGVQISGVINIAAGKLTGGQVGVLNYATTVKGVQVGLLNISDTIQGIPFGIFNFVLKGYHKIEVSADEIFYTNLAFRTGIQKFYNIFTVGAKPDTFNEDGTYWTFGYGFGTAPKLSRWLHLNIDLTSNQIVHDQKFEVINLLNKLYLGLDFQTFKKLSFTLGATVNGYLTKANHDGYAPLFTDYHPDSITDTSYSNNLNLKVWLGAKVGVRFL
jgi:hypothetical protein